MVGRNISIKHNDAACTIEMNNPGKMNALTGEVIGELQAALTDISADRETRVVVLQGAGGNFCSGADLAFLGANCTPQDSYRVMERVGGLIKSMRELPQPVICKVRGVAYGGGANLALSGDFVIAAHGARICEVFVNVGLTLDCGGTYLLPRLIGMMQARALALLGEELDGKTAAAMGLIYKCCPDEELDREVDSLAAILSRKPRSALATIKKGLNRSFDMTLDEALDWEASYQSLLLQGAEHKQALAALLESKKKK